MVPETVLFALVLEEMEGVGRVTANRLLAHFPTYDDLVRFPREQVLSRIKGTPGSEHIVQALFDGSAMKARIDEARRRHDRLQERHIQVLVSNEKPWPDGLDDLPRDHRPFLFYAYGSLDVLSMRTAGLFAQPPLSGPSFERAQMLARTLIAEGIAPVTGIAHGFDVVIHKLCSTPPKTSPSLLVASCGLASIQPPVRPTVSAVVRSRGLVISPFPMNHGPFAHDDKDRALIMAAMTSALVFVEPRPETPEWHAMTWALEAGRPVFGIGGDAGSMPDDVHPVLDDVDVEWVLTAAKERT